MNFDEIYEMMQAQLRTIFDAGREMVHLTIAEFMQLYQMVCYMKQIKHIVDGV